MRYRIVTETNLDATPTVHSHHRWWLAARVVAWIFTWRHPRGVATVQRAADLPIARLR